MAAMSNLRQRRGYSGNGVLCLCEFLSISLSFQILSGSIFGAL
jgi:hypothetical protein